MSPHVGGSVYTPKRTVDSNRRGFSEQRTRLSPVSNRVDQSDGPDGRGPTPLTMTWVGGFSTETTEKFMGAEFLEQKQYSMYRQLRDASKRAEPVGPRCRLMCLVYIRCLFCEASGTSSIVVFCVILHWDSM